jgi:hypothetical protein
MLIAFSLVPLPDEATKQMFDVLAQRRIDARLVPVSPSFATGQHVRIDP